MVQNDYYPLWIYSRPNYKHTRVTNCQCVGRFYDVVSALKGWICLMNESLLSSLAFFCFSEGGPGINYALCSTGGSGLLFRQWMASWSSPQSSCCWPSGTQWGCAASSPGGAAPAPACCSPRSRCRPAAAGCPPPLAPSSCSRWPRHSWLWRTRPASWPEGRAPRAESWTWSQRLKVILAS